MHKRALYILLLLLVVGIALWLLLAERKQYYTNQGMVFGTYYSVRYEASSDLHDSIRAAFAAFDNSLSMFNPESTISRISNNTDSVIDGYFHEMYETAVAVHTLSDGAFDITIAPLVHLWGFGLSNRTSVREEQVDSLLPYVGMDHLCLLERDDSTGGKMYILRKSDPAVMIDAGAIAKGQSCDMIASLLVRNGCQSYLVDIGGEVVAHGLNAQGAPWRIGITQPIEDATGQTNTPQTIIQTTDIALATSGNYRNFYYEGTQKRSHTIDPRTGRPVQHSLLSATVRSNSCMRADALATACMVLGADEAIRMIEADSVSACYLIVADAPNDSTYSAERTRVLCSSRWAE